MAGSSSSIRAWVQAARPLAVGNVIIPVLWGSAYAAGTAPMRWQGLALACAWAWIDQLFIVFANDLADERVDRLGRATPMSGGSRVLVEGKLTPRQLARAAALAATALLALSLALSWSLHSWVPLACGGAALVLMWAYSFAPLRLSYGRGGMLAQALGMGVVLPILGFVLQGRELVDINWLALGPTMSLAASSHLLTALPDIEGDRRGHKRTRAVRVGEARARVEAFAWMLLAVTLATAFAGVSITAASSAIALIVVGYAFARRFVRDPVGRVRFAWVGLVVNSALWVGWIVWLLRGG